MASEKKPSIYYDRGTIGSSDELDEYGVWVKSEPQDLSSVGVESRETADIPDPELPDMDDLPDFGASSDDGFDEPSGFDESSGFDEPSGFDESPEADISVDEDMELPDIDFEDDKSAEEGETIDFGETDSVSADSDEAGDTESFEFTELPEPDFSDFTESMDSTESPDSIESGEEGAEDGEPASGDEAESLGFVEVPMDTLEDDSIQALDDSGEGERVPKETKPSSPDLSTQLLMRIADELASIRGELSTLKNEFAGLKTGSAPAETDETQNRGFFDEEDDEKIALTGDELDNILNTADFTEEAGADATEELGGDFETQEAEDNSSGPFQEITETPSEEAEIGDISFDDITKDLDLDINLEEKDLDELGGEINLDQSAGFDEPGQDNLLEEPVEFDIDLGEGGEDFSAGDPLAEDLPDLEDKDSEELRQIREEGALPMTPAPEPEDASFLEEDPLASADFSEESLDLSNAVIDEPDLSGEIQENPLEEPSLDDISIDLDLDEEISLDEGNEDEIGGTEEIESSEEEIELPLSDESFGGIGEEEPEDSPAETDADLAVIPEGFVVEAEDSSNPTVDDGEEVFSETIEPEIMGDDAVLEEEKVEEILPPVQEESGNIPSHLKQELKTVLSYMDQLLESLPDEKIEEFAKSEYFDTYKKLFKELGLV